MLTKEIPRELWLEFFQGFTSAHRGWLATIEVLGNEPGAQAEAKERPFEGISAEMGRGSDKDSISLLIGATRDQHLIHMIAHPKHVRLDETNEGATDTLRIESDDETTLVHFYAPNWPELDPDTILE